MTVSPDYLQRCARRLDHFAALDSALAPLHALVDALADPAGEWPGTIQRTWSWLPTHYVAELDGDHWQRTLETLSTHAGDCEDWAIALAAMLKANGIDARLVTIPQHVAVAVPMAGTELGWELHVHRGRSWLFLESTIDLVTRLSVPPGSDVEMITPYVNTPYLQIAGMA